MADTPAGFARKLDKIADSLHGAALQRALTAAGLEAKRNIKTAVTNTLGDQSMSNWRRGKPIEIGGRFDKKSDSIIEIGPARRAAGPMRVLESGRRAGVSKRKSHRPVSASKGKGTWSHAEETMKRSLPRVVDLAVVATLRKTFRG